MNAASGFPKKTRILVTPINSIGIEEPLAREKLCPVLSFYVANSPKQAIAQSRATLRATGAGHSAVIHSQNERMILDFASRVECYRVVVNASCSLGASGFNTNLAPSFTIGTGFYGRSSLGENLGPQHLIHWTQIAYNSDPSVVFGKFNELSLSRFNFSDILEDFALKSPFSTAVRLYFGRLRL